LFFSLNGFVQINTAQELFYLPECAPSANDRKEEKLLGSDFLRFVYFHSKFSSFFRSPRIGSIERRWVSGKKINKN
jgi:hypothetical protein